MAITHHLRRRSRRRGTHHNRLSRTQWHGTHASELLEPRRLLASVTVNYLTDFADASSGATIAQLIANPGPDGRVSLREAIVAAGNTPGHDNIGFSTFGTIEVQSQLPTLVDVSLDGRQGVAPGIELDGTDAPANTSGLIITGVGTTVRGMVINRFKDMGIEVFAAGDEGGGGNVIAGNYIGTDKTGMLDRGNAFHGIHVEDALNTTIGGVADADRNVISGNTEVGVLAIFSSGTIVRKNYIGVAKDGETPLGNGGAGVTFYDSKVNAIDGRNIISGNFNGVVIGGAQSVENLVYSNYIGTDKDGEESIPNTWAGVLLTSFSVGSVDHGPATQNHIGGGIPAQRNVISGNGRNGIEFFGGVHGNFVRGNFIGMTADGMNSLGNGGDGSEPFSGFGIDFGGGAHHNIIGGDADDGVDGNRTAANLISGNVRGGISVDGNAPNNSIIGNNIGVNAAGSAAMANHGDGIKIDGSDGTIVGGSRDDGSYNVIVGNDGDGISVKDASGTTILGNIIGIQSIPNLGSGVLLDNAPDNFIGAATEDVGTGAGNLIQGNFGAGIKIQGAVSSNNAVYGNAIEANGVNGIHIDNAPANKIGAAPVTVSGDTHLRRNFIGNNGPNGVLLSGPLATGNTLLANYIGVSTDGTAASANGENGVAIDQAPGNIIGAGNVISGNFQNGVRINGLLASANIIKGSHIGTNAAGTAGVANMGSGVLVVDAPGTKIGGNVTGSALGDGNLISGNAEAGIFIQPSETALDSVITGNLIGTNLAGTAGVPNTYGIVTAAANTRVGGNRPATGTARGEGNVISGNLNQGVVFTEDADDGKVRGNTIGLGLDGNALANSTGVHVINSAGVLIGALPDDPDRDRQENVISGNHGDGVVIEGVDSFDVDVFRNFVGTDRAGMLDRGNGGSGVKVGAGASDVRISFNNISGNAREGVTISGEQTTGVVLTSNFIGISDQNNIPIPNDSAGVYIENAPGNFVGGQGFENGALRRNVGSSRVDLQACKLEYSIVSPK